MRELPYKKIAIIFAVVWMGIGFVALAYYLLGFISNIILWVALAGVLSYMLYGPAIWIEKRFPRLPWSLIVILLYVLIFLAILLISTGIGVSLSLESRGLQDDFARFVESAKGWAESLQTLLGRFGVELNLQIIEERGLALLQQNGSTVLNAFLGLLDKISSGLSQLFLILIISLYFLLESRQISASFFHSVPEGYRDELRQLGSDMGRVVGGYTRGILTLALLIGVLAGVGAALFGLPYALAIGVFAAVFDLIPIVGSILGGIPAVIIAFVFKGVPTTLAVIAYFVVINQVESNYLQPRIAGESVDLSPLATMLALLIGTQLAGIIGALLAVPVLSSVLVFVRYLVKWYRHYTSGVETFSPQGNE